MRVQVKVTGLDELERKFKFAKQNANKYMSAAGKEATERFVLGEEGIKKYPPETAANQPGRVRSVRFSDGRTATFRAPYYVRGKGSVIPVRGGRWKQLHNSQRYGTKWYIKRVPYGVKVGNSASYAPYLTGASMQSKAMAKIGWRKLVDVANQNMPKITAVFQAWVEKLHKDAKLK